MRARSSVALTLYALLTIGALSLTGCGGSTANDSEPHASSHNRTYTGPYPIRVACTTGMVADLVSNIGGEHVETTTLMGAGVDPHLYNATPADVTALNRADIIFYSGLHLEGKLAELLERMRERKPTVAVAEVIPTDKIRRDEHGAPDPHIWFDVELWSLASRAVHQGLSEFDPKHAEEYRQNAVEYQSNLAQLDANVAEDLKTIPAERRVLVTAHDAFHYFGDAYGVEVRAIQGISTDSEAGVRQIKELVDFLVERKIKAVFVETSVSDQNIRSLLEGCQARGHEVVIGGTLFSDAMGDEGTPEGTYEGMVRANVKTIVNALQ